MARLSYRGYNRINLKPLRTEVTLAIELKKVEGNTNSHFHDPNPKKTLLDR